MILPKSILVTGGCGFIGTNFIRYLFKKEDSDLIVVNLDRLSTGGSLGNLRDIEQEYGNRRYFFHLDDIRHYSGVTRILEKYGIDTVVHFAAESHVDRSISDPSSFIETNIGGTYTLLKACKDTCSLGEYVRFHHISTDEVYGSLGETGYFYETSPYDPSSPYAASKAASDHLVKSYFKTYGLPVTISNCSNNFGPYQCSEKLIPLAISRILNGEQIPVYGDGKNVRDWIYVEDHCEAIWEIITRGKVGESYNVGGNCEKENVQILSDIVDVLSSKIPIKSNPFEYVPDRLGHDRRYAVNCEKIQRELGWKPRFEYKDSLADTVNWYLQSKK